ncbi:MAG: hypothetical protein HND48_19125 [Chloroflexi bacterium]|nr:hypothetical protein [Chloroflexota bacterium]
MARRYRDHHRWPDVVHRRPDRGRAAPAGYGCRDRLKAEHLRREYFRYLMRLEPYDGIEDRFDRETLLAKRAADINRGFFPESPVQPK